MATIVAAAGGGNFTTGGSWVGGVAPTAADDAQLSGSSGNITIDAGAVCRSLDCTGYTGTLTHTAGVTLTIGDATAGASSIALKFVAGMTYTLGNATTSAISFISTSATVQSVDFAAKTTGNIVYNASSNGSWSLGGTHNTGTAATVTLTKGTLNTNGQTCSWGLFSSNNSNTRALTLGASAITITGTGTVWGLNTITGLTLTNNTGTISCSGSNVTWQGGGATYRSVAFTGSGSNIMAGANTFTTLLSVTGTAVKTDNFTLNANQTVQGTFTLAGNSAINRLLLQSNTLGTARTITNSGAVMTWSNVDIMDMSLGTVNDVSARTDIGDCGGNTNITFPAGVAQTWSGTSGGNWSANAWTTRIPLPQDDVTIASAFSGGQTVTADMPRLGRSITFAGASGTPTFSQANNTIYGSLTLISGMVLSAAGNMIFGGRSSYTITNAGLSWGSQMLVNAPGGTYTLQDAMVTSSNLIHNNGTFATNNVALTVFGVASNGSATRALTLGTSTITLTSNASVPWDVVSAGMTMSAASATIVFSTASASTRTFGGASFTYGTLTYTVAGSTGTMIITGSNTFGTINFSDVTNARTLRFTAGTTTTITSAFNVNGTAGKLMSVQSVTAATHTLAKASGTVSCVYLNLTNSIAGGGAAWYAGTNSVDNGGNTGWIFTAPPASGVTPKDTSHLGVGKFGIANLARL